MGATVLDSLVVELGLDPSKFTDGSRKYRDEDKKNRDNANESAKRMVDQNKKAAESFGQIKREALGLFATIVGARGLEQFVVQTVKGFTAVDIAAKQAGLSVKQFQAYQNMISRNGGDGAAAGQAVAGLAGTLEQWRALGQLDQGHRRAFSAIGVGRDDNALDVTAKFANWAGGQKDKQYVALMGQMAGLTPDMIDKAMQGGAAHKAGMAESLRLGVASEDQIKKTRELQNRMTELTQAVKYDAQSMLVDLAPALTGMIKGAAGLVGAFPQVTKAAIAAAVALWALSGLRVVGGLLSMGGGAAAAAEGAEVAAAGGAEVTGVAVEGAAAVGAGGLLATLAGGALALGAWAIPTSLNKGEGSALQKMERSRIIKSQLIKLGWSDEEASGILAGITAENGSLDPTAQGPMTKAGHRAYGLGQTLSADRLASFKRLFGHDIRQSTEQEQIAFIDWEIRHSQPGAYAAIKGKSAHAAMLGYLTKSMRPGAGLGGDVARGNRALMTHITVANMNVSLPNAKDAAGMKRDLPKTFANNPNVSQANSGLQ